jgi:hypothetical protein
MITFMSFNGLSVMLTMTGGKVDHLHIGRKE